MHVHRCGSDRPLVSTRTIESGSTDRADVAPARSVRRREISWRCCSQPKITTASTTLMNASARCTVGLPPESVSGTLRSEISRGKQGQPIGTAGQQARCGRTNTPRPPSRLSAPRELGARRRRRELAAGVAPPLAGARRSAQAVRAARAGRATRTRAARPGGARTVEHNASRCARPRSEGAEHGRCRKSHTRQREPTRSIAVADMSATNTLASSAVAVTMRSTYGAFSEPTARLPPSRDCDSTAGSRSRSTASLSCMDRSSQRFRRHECSWQAIAKAVA